MNEKWCQWETWCPKWNTNETQEAEYILLLVPLANTHPNSIPKVKPNARAFSVHEFPYAMPSFCFLFFHKTKVKKGENFKVFAVHKLCERELSPTEKEVRVEFNDIPPSFHSIFIAFWSWQFQHFHREHVSLRGELTQGSSVPGVLGPLKLPQAIAQWKLNLVSLLMRKLDESVLLFINHSVIVFSVCMDNFGESILSRVQWSRASKDAEWRALRLLFRPPIHGCFLARILINLSLFPLFSLFTTVTFRVCSFMVLENLNDLGTILFSIAVSFFFLEWLFKLLVSFFFFCEQNNWFDEFAGDASGLFAHYWIWTCLDKKKTKVHRIRIPFWSDSLAWCTI